MDESPAETYQVDISGSSDSDGGSEDNEGLDDLNDASEEEDYEGNQNREVDQQADGENAPNDANEDCEEDENREVDEEDNVENAPLPTDRVENGIKAGNRTRGQIAAYAGVALSMSFRSHFFSVLILGSYARFMRWDRRGAIVTHRFSYATRPDLMFNFYLRYGQLSLRQRWFDDLVTEHWGTLPKSVQSTFNKYYQDS